MGYSFGLKIEDSLDNCQTILLYLFTMGFKSLLGKPFAKIIGSQVKGWAANPIRCQEKIFAKLVSKGARTSFGRDHDLKGVDSYDAYKHHVPIIDYEKMRPYVEQIIDGAESVLWPGKPIYFAKTAGTTSGEKYIPITKDSIPNHMDTARNALLLYILETTNSRFADGKMIFISGNPKLETKGGILTGRLSGIVNHHIPGYLRSNHMPTFDTNCIEDWENKIEKIVDETIGENMTLISGIPPWVQMYYDHLIERAGKKIKDIFPEFSLFVHGGVNFKPYREKLEDAVGKKIDTIETYPSSEGFIAFQDTMNEEGLLLNVNSGIFFEFIPSKEVHAEQPTRVSLEDVELGVNYVIILNSYAGLYGYNIGDTVRFVSKDPYRLIVTGRISHFISAFGEHVIGEEVVYALTTVAGNNRVEINEFTVAPQVNPDNGGLPYHEWFIEFGDIPEDMEAFAREIDEQLQNRNSYYKDLILGKVLQTLKITAIQQNGFRNFMKSKGKLGGQNKVPRLSNSRNIADDLDKWKILNN